jgi:hypothetical protein
MALHARVVGRYGRGGSITDETSNHHSPTPGRSPRRLADDADEHDSTGAPVAVRAGRVMMLERWFIGGDRSRDDPALVTMIENSTATALDPCRLPLKG